MNVFDLWAKLSLDTSRYDQGLANASGLALNTGKQIISVFMDVADKLTGIVKQAVDSYSQYEQLVGGVETLFKESSNTVLANAQQAYRTAGISANEYMNTVTSFSASLIQSTGRGAQTDLAELEANLNEQYKTTKRHWEDRIALVEDSAQKVSLRRQMEDDLEMLKAHNKQVLAEAQEANMMSVSTAESLERAAQLADMAIVDMSDNANKMGTDMGMLMNAYNGFAKQNYMMLDNLKLGYGGTRAEMERLLKDAERLSGIKFDISSYADIVQAIHVIQEDLGIAGTTAKEATETIEGSLKMMKSAWQDMLVSFAGGGKTIEESMNGLVEAVGYVVQNIFPVVIQAIYGIADLIYGIAPIIAERLPELVTTLLPMLLETILFLVQAIVAELPYMVGALGDAVIGMLPQIVETFFVLFNSALTDIIPALLEVGMAMVIALGQGLADNAESLIDAIVFLLGFIVNLVIENFPTIYMLGLQIILALVQGLLENMNELTDMIMFALTELQRVIIDNIPAFLEMGMRILVAIAEGILLAIPSLLVSIGRVLGIVEKADRSVKDSGDSMKSSMDSTLTDMTFSMESASKRISQSSKDIGTVTESAYKQTKDYSKEVVANARWAEQLSTDVLTKLKISFEGMVDHSRRFYENLKYYVNQSLELLRELSNFSARPLVDASGVEMGCSAIINAVNGAIAALQRLNSTSAGGGGFGGGRASGGWISSGTTYLVGEEGPELITASSNAFVHDARETAGILGGRGDIYVTIQGDVYDDERSMRQKFRTAITQVIEEEMSYA